MLRKPQYYRQYYYEYTLGFNKLYSATTSNNHSDSMILN